MLGTFQDPRVLCSHVTRSSIFHVFHEKITIRKSNIFVVQIVYLPQENQMLVISSIPKHIPKSSNSWLVVWNIWIIFPYIGNNHPN